jgi:uncharacterized Zn-binding protein involved in type VI secretion
MLGLLALLRSIWPKPSGRQPVARVGDPGSHGGALASGSPTTFADGRAVARIGDTLNCARHGAQPMVGGSSVLCADGKGVCRVGDAAACGATITAGSPMMQAA